MDNRFRASKKFHICTAMYALNVENTEVSDLRILIILRMLLNIFFIPLYFCPSINFLAYNLTYTSKAPIIPITKFDGI